LLIDEGYRPKQAFLAVRDSFDRRVLLPAGRVDPLLTPQGDPTSPFTPVPYLPSDPPRY
jgi:hypothetical protein